MSNKGFKYKKDHNLEERQKESNRILKEYINRMPVICECDPNSNLVSLKKTKYLVPSDMTVAQFQFLIRRNLDLDEYSALFFLTADNKTITGDRTMMEVYNIFKDKQDNFLYLQCIRSVCHCIIPSYT